ncbi:MAG: hypothetical protein ACKVOI_06530 [Dongiaceae bacterium]
MKMYVLTIAVFGGTVLLSAPLATVSLAENMVDTNKCMEYTNDLRLNLMLVGAAGKNYDASNQALADAEDQHKKGEHKACIETAMKGITDMGLPTNTYPE